MFTAQQQSRKQEIIALFSQGTVDDKLFAELKQLNEAEKQAKVEREGEVAGLANSIGEIQLTFAELMSLQFNNKPLFASTEIMDYARGQGWKFAGAVASDSGEQKTRKTRTPKEGLLLIEIQPPGAKGGAARILKGDKLPAQGIGAKMLWLAQQPGDLAENLMAKSVKSQEVQDYLASDEGKAEFKQWLDFIAKHAPTKADTKKDGDKKEPAHAADGKQAQTAKHK